ncbi:hypothetical protein ISCGN_002867 [Ixodes scapularis]
MLVAKGSSPPPSRTVPNAICGPKSAAEAYFPISRRGAAFVEPQRIPWSAATPKTPPPSAATPARATDPAVLAAEASAIFSASRVISCPFLFPVLPSLSYAALELYLAPLRTGIGGASAFSTRPPSAAAQRPSRAPEPRADAAVVGGPRVAPAAAGSRRGPGRRPMRNRAGYDVRNGPRDVNEDARRGEALGEPRARRRR